MALALLKHGRRYTFVQTHGARALMAARLARLPAVRLRHVFHEVAENQGLRGLLELRLARGLSVAANAPFTADSIRRRLGVPVDVIPPVVRIPQLLTRYEAEQVLGLPGDELTIGVVGRLAAVKAPALVVQAAAWLERGPIRVVYVGEGPERDRILADARALGMNVSLVGPRPAAERLLAAFDVVACPSPVESFGLVMAQAAVAQRPVAIVDSPGARYVSDGGRLITLCLPTPEGLAGALVSALEASAASRERLRSHVLGRFGPDVAYERVRAFYARQLKPFPPGDRFEN
jgi:glycosyltransferase involved in cell wall biosynthesis